MRAAYFERYGPVDNLSVRDVPIPELRDGHLLVRNRASSIGYGNVGHVKAEPFLIRAATGFFNPKFKTPGNDVAGVVESVGPGVSQFKAGDEVIADSSATGFGAFAEYVLVSEGATCLKPKGISFEEAATLPMAGGVAYTALVELGGLIAGQHVMLVGSTGSVGSFAVQLAKALGAEVTGVCSGRNADYVSALGADHIVDYTKEDFPARSEQYDIVLGIAGTHGMAQFRDATKEGGIFVQIGGGVRQFLAAATIGPFVFKKADRRFSLLLHAPKASNLKEVVNLVESGKLCPTYEKVFLLDQIIDAYRYYETEKPPGKVVIAI